MLTWSEFREAQPDLAVAGQSMLYEWKLGLGFLATVRSDGGPRVHPICPVITDDGAFYVTGVAIERAALLTLTEASDVLPKGHTVWKAG